MNDQLSRRDVLSMAAPLALMAGLADKIAVPRRYSGNADPELHLLRRTTFGPNAADRSRLKQVGRQAWLSEQLAADLEIPASLSQRLDGLGTLSMSPIELLELDDQPRVAREQIAATLLRHTYNPNQLFELMVDFWSDHFNLYLRDGPVLFLKGVDDREVIRRHALGYFPDMLRASAHSPAMLVYLDNAQSQAPEPNENYARELLELHTLGVDGGYDHADIDYAALALTGWTVTPLRGFRFNPGTFLYREDWHQDPTGEFLGSQLPGSGYDLGLAMLDRLALHPSTARHLATKLCLRFVSDDPTTSLVNEISSVYLNTRGHIPSILRAIFSADEFNQNQAAKVKRGLDYVVSALRVMEVSQPPQRLVASALQALGHVPFQWPAPDGYPHENDAWVNSNQLLARWAFALQLFELPAGATGLPAPSWADEGSAHQLAAAADHVFGEALEPDTGRIFADYLRSADGRPDWRQLLSLLLASPQFQRR